ncbi:MAG: S6e family ribosomal protein [Nanoarchaeota archaeon]
MVFKINIADKTGKTYKLEVEGKNLEGKELHDKINGNEISPDLEGYELEITGASDKSGFTAMKEVEGVGLKRLLLRYGKAMKKRPKKEGKKKRSKNKPKGLRLKKTVRGKVISENIVQINLKVLKQGKKSLKDIFEKPVEEPKKEESSKTEEKPVEEKKTEEKPKKEEKSSEEKKE